MKRFIYYFIWMIIIFAFCFIGLYFQTVLEKNAAANFNYRSVVVFYFTFPVFVGVLLRTPQFILEFRNKEGWAFDWQKCLAIILLPLLLYGALVTFWYFQIMKATILFTTFGSSTFLTIIGIIVGYTL